MTRRGPIEANCDYIVASFAAKIIDRLSGNTWREWSSKKEELKGIDGLKMQRDDNGRNLVFRSRGGVVRG